MATNEPLNAFTVGVEEEYQLVDAETLALKPRISEVLPPARQRVGDDVQPELHQAMIEIGTRVCRSLAEVRAELVRLRGEVGAAAEARGSRIVAAGTHPFSGWEGQRITDKDSYRMLLDDYAQLAREQLVFGFHVHVAVPDQELAIQTINRARPWLPVLLAMSASSPFWQGVDTGYASYRTEVFGRWPTTGTPGLFASRAEFDRLVASMVASGAIDEPARIYWSIRPSARYPTLEFRVADVCTSVDDAVLIAGVVRALARRCAEEAEAGRPYAEVRPELLRPAMWRAARHGLTDQLVDLGVDGPRLVPAPTAVAQLLDFVRPALAGWGDRSEVEALAAALLEGGTSAEKQRSVLRRTGDVRAVAKWLVDETARGSRPG